MNFSIKRNDLIEWLNVVHKSLIDVDGNLQDFITVIIIW
jgi:hypothetical protein